PVTGIPYIDVYARARDGDIRKGCHRLSHPPMAGRVGTSLAIPGCGAISGRGLLTGRPYLACANSTWRLPRRAFAIFRTGLGRSAGSSVARREITAVPSLNSTTIFSAPPIAST